MVPYGQAMHSPDRERQLTFRSQKIDEHIIIIIYESRKIGRPAVKTARSVRDRREQKSVLSWYLAGRLRTLLTMPNGCGDLRSNPLARYPAGRLRTLETGENIK